MFVPVGAKPDGCLHEKSKPFKFILTYFNLLETEGPRVRASLASLRCGP